MMGKPRRHFWSSWPLDSQLRFFKMVLLGSMLVTLSTLIGFRLFAGTVVQQIADAKEQYGRVITLVEDVRALRAQMGDLAQDPVEDAVWSIIDDLVIEDHLTAIRSSKLDDENTGILVTFTGLSLTKLTNFLSALRDRASLQTPECVITRNADDPRLADAHFVLAR